MIYFFLLIAASASAQGPWKVTHSTSALIAAESVVVYGGAPDALKADPASSNTSDFVVVDAVQKDGAWSWTLLPLSTGTLSFTARFVAPDGKAVSAPPVSMTVAGTGVPDEVDISDIKGPFKARPALWPWLLAALLGAAAWEGWRRWKARRLEAGEAPAPAEPALPPEIIAERAIASLRASGLWQRDQAAYYLSLTDILRAYLEARYGEPVTAMTSVEVERLVKKRARDLQIGGSVRDLLSRADLVKFAKARPGADDGERDAALALSVVKATTPRAYPPKEAAP